MNIQILHHPGYITYDPKSTHNYHVHSPAYNHNEIIVHNQGEKGEWTCQVGVLEQIAGSLSVKSHWLIIPAAAAIDCDSFAAEAVCELIGSIHGVYG